MTIEYTTHKPIANRTQRNRMSHHQVRRAT